MSWDADIPPEMSSIAVDQVCWGHIKGVANLHKFCIAHRDIKTEDILVGWDFLSEHYRLRCRYESKGRGRGGGRWLLQGEGLDDDAQGRGEVDVQPDQGRLGVKRVSSSLSS